MELVITREGRVETVRLLTPATRMTDMLLLSGAKTWKFAPALKEGQPVRYRTRFSWEATP
jgi:outer membrane biosynthesis protein TonB